MAQYGETCRDQGSISSSKADEGRSERIQSERETKGGQRRNTAELIDLIIVENGTHNHMAIVSAWMDWS